MSIVKYFQEFRTSVFADLEEKQVEDYKKMIFDIIEKIENYGALEYLYTFIKLFVEKWG